MEKIDQNNVRVFAGELILCLSEIRRIAGEPTIYLDRIAKAISKILDEWEPYATKALGLPPAVRDDAETGFSRKGIIDDVDIVLNPLIIVRVRLGEMDADADQLPQPHVVRAALVGAVLLLRNLRNKGGIRQAADELERLRVN